MPQNPSISQLDSTNIFQRAFDESEDRLRVDAEVTANISGAQEVIINQNDDTIAIGDGAILFTGTTVGPSHGLDVNILGGAITGNVTAIQPPLNSFQTGQYTIGTTIVQLTPSPLSNRSSISLRVTCTGSNSIFIGNSSSTTTLNGYPLYNGDTIQMDLSPTNSLFAIASAEEQTAFVLEIA